jgi:uncharacterized RDD family membrane protein YckC
MAMSAVIYAGFWRRAASLLIDLLVLGPLLAAGFWARGQSPFLALGACAAASVVSVAYSIWFHARWGQTLGKMAMRIRVTSVDGSPITARQAWLRSSVDVIVNVVAIVGLAIACVGWTGPEWGALDVVTREQLILKRNPLSFH